jgi:hypothetical protein
MTTGHDLDLETLEALNDDRVRRQERRNEVLTLRAAGFTWRHISERTGVTVTTVQRDYEIAVRDSVRDTAQELAARQQAIITKTIHVNWAGFLQGEPAATKHVYQALERQARLFGLDAPARVRVAVTDEDFSVTMARMMVEIGLRPPPELAAALPAAEKPADLPEEPVDAETVDDWVN